MRFLTFLFVYLRPKESSNPFTYTGRKSRTLRPFFSYLYRAAIDRAFLDPVELIYKFILPIITLIVGGFLPKLFDFILGKGKSKQNSLEYFTNEIKEDNKRLREDINRKSATAVEMNHRLSMLYAKIALLESTHSHLPFPMWLKDTDELMLTINPYLTRLLGVLPEDYIGKKHSDVWGEETSKRLTDAYNEVLRTGNSVYHPVSFEVNGNIIKTYACQFPRKINNAIIGVGGIFIDIEKFKQD